MQLSLSSAAGPDAALEELLAASARRGLAAIELVAGDAHGISLGADRAMLARAQRAVVESGVHICALRCEQLREGEIEAAADLAAALGAPIVTPADGLAPGFISAAAQRFAAAGARLLLQHGTSAAAVEMLSRGLDALDEASPLGLAWEYRPDSDDPWEVPGVVAAAGRRLQHVRLLGGGPEAARQTGRGVGALMARLALARYAGPLAIAPSDPRYHFVWRAWLGRAGGWGCGSKGSTLITLERPGAAAGEGARA